MPIMHEEETLGQELQPSRKTDARANISLMIIMFIIRTLESSIYILIPFITILYNTTVFGGNKVTDSFSKLNI